MLLGGGSKPLEIVMLSVKPFNGAGWSCIVMGIESHPLVLTGPSQFVIILMLIYILTLVIVFFLIQIHWMRRMQSPRKSTQTLQLPLSQGALSCQAAVHPAHLLVVRSRGRHSLHSLHSLLRLLALLRRMKVTPLSTCHPQSLTDLCAVCV